ncbi:two-component sensor histidine kinase [Bradyrhizobium sp. AUGA SZCCT0222]|uniref:ATP-binding protein n=1 Tax=Bradyrhizobium sp. AUGA SZCCT0222 TaxID=2807668 RepID=UPI001BA8F63A|nr:ATP-binding protein [Bradyrhizobium sp. AUGA SZCCT0222]MBR1269373.1 two-component sensor histidine kinase [Bradyrhizobium sp. AUGA SZCCT0222]
MLNLQFARSNTFRWTLMVAGVLAAFILALFGFIYWTIDDYLIARSDRVISAQIDGIAGLTPERRLEAIDERLRQDPRGVQLATIFAADGRRITGNLESLPAGLTIDAPPQGVDVIRIDRGGREHQTVRAIARRMRNGDVLVIGRNVDETREISRVVGQALALGLLPGFCLCLLAGAWLSVRAQKRVEEVNQRVRRIIAGDLRERLPHRTVDEPFSKLAIIVNGMLDEMETMIHALAGVGNDIAHDLRTPLTRARLVLERGRTNATSLEQLQAVADKAIAGIDQSLTIITALLRLAEIENSRRSAGFGDVNLHDMLREVHDIYEPIAENKDIALQVEVERPLTVRGDRDLLIEAVANLVDNAIKFTPEGGKVSIKLVRDGSEPVIRVTDTGSGISEHEREAVLRRFYRSDKIRNTPGVGLGLNLVAAIVKLHGFRLTIHSGPCCQVEIACPDQPG